MKLNNLVENLVLLTQMDEKLKQNFKQINLSVKTYDEIFERFYRMDSSHNSKTGGTGINLMVNSKAHTIEANDLIAIYSGVYKLNAGKDALHTDNEDISLGNVFINTGEFIINAEDESIKSSGNQILISPNMTIQSKGDAINSKQNVIINGGIYALSTDDDGIHADENVSINNGNITISKSYEGIEGFSIDYNGEAIITGGTLIATGAKGMAQNFGQNSTQPSLLYYINDNTEKVIIRDENSKELISFSPDKFYNSIVFSSPELKVGATYTIEIEGETEQVTLDDIITGEGHEGMGGHGAPPRPEDRGDFRPKDEKRP